ncbi:MULTISPECIES: hypothetical protein [unclassified Micromonospora]|uniref:hypothetical protein n=1 Tax=unclassified Micromonospora TaxID=2617518 RepID=UPI00098D4905|nr:MULTISPECIES: hypothetical protein [unclassified Micromonospora]MDI5936968.1 hypothetical protein [Micromonospora sp. DH15]OON30141.1 hypothetical protein BSA16_17725 [Micromonospora sp. Rc5]
MSTEVPRQFKPNLVLVNRRKAAGWESRRRAARELHRVGLQRGIRETPTVEAIEKAMYRHETGRVAVTDPIYRQLYCLAYDAKPHDLFGELATGAEDRPHFSVRSHKFVPAFVGAEGAALLRESAGCTPAAEQWYPCHSTPVAHPEGGCTLYVWPCGSVVFHLVEAVEFSTIAALAFWRKVSYGDNIRWATEFVSRFVPDVDESTMYVFGTHWLAEPAWPTDLTETALRIMATPSVLLHRDRVMDDEHLAHAELIEQSLLSDAYDHGGIESFGVRGISSGYASWSGVVYHPVAVDRSLTESELVACGLAIQSMWVYTDAITRQIEQGKDPEVSPGYGWRYLRGVRSRLTTSRPRETGQHQAMRRAVLQTSDLMPALEQAIETLRDTDRG